MERAGLLLDEKGQAPDHVLPGAYIRGWKKRASF